MQYLELSYDYHTDGDFTDWLEDVYNRLGFELVTIVRMHSDKIGEHMCVCVFKK